MFPIAGADFISVVVLRGIGALLNKPINLALALRANCGCRVAHDSLRPRLPLGWTRKWSPPTLLYQGFWERKIQEKEAVDDVVEWITFSV